MRAILLLLVLPAILLSAPKPGDEGTAEYRVATELVKDLGSSRFSVREMAAKKLLEMGGPAIPALLAGAKSADVEVRNRSANLLPQAQAIAWGRRADAFLAHRDGQPKDDLPLLAEWEKLAEKSDPGARKLFADMLRTNGPLFELAASDRAAAVPALMARSSVLLDTARVKGKQIEISATDIAAILFVQTVLKNPVKVGASAGREPLYLLANPALAQALDAKDIGPSIRRLMVQWVKSRPAEETMTSLFFALLAHRHPFAEADPHLIQLATAHKSGQIRWVAMEALGRSKGKAAHAKLTELLADKSSMYPELGGDGGNRMCDCALAALANGRGKKPSDYGLKTYMIANFWVGGEADTITLHLCGFKSAADRDRGIKKWQAESAAKK